jgi:DNA-binding PadR family transcriptional regulator
MEHGTASDSLPVAQPAQNLHPDFQPIAPSAERPPATDRLLALQHAFLLEQLASTGGSKLVGELNGKIPAAAKRELQLNKDTANMVRAELAKQHYLETTKNGQKVSYSLTEAGRAYLAGLERPRLVGRTKQPAPLDEATISDEVREAQKGYLLLQLLDADGQPLSRGDANRFKNGPYTSLGLKPAIANHRRAKLAEQGYIHIARTARAEEYTLTPDGLDYLASNTRHLQHAIFKVKGKTLNALVAAARESPFEHDRPGASPTAERPVPSPSELAEVVLAEFQDLWRERHGRSGLVPIHELRQRIAERLGPTAARHDILDEVILGLWRQQHLGLEAISDLGEVSEQQLNDSIQGVHGTLFYLEAPREQPVTS